MKLHKLAYIYIHEYKQEYMSYCGEANIHSLLIKHFTLSPHVRNCFFKLLQFCSDFMIGY
jgi:hypothetical protein